MIWKKRSVDCRSSSQGAAGKELKVRGGACKRTPSQTERRLNDGDDDEGRNYIDLGESDVRRDKIDGKKTEQRDTEKEEIKDRPVNRKTEN